MTHLHSNLKSVHDLLYRVLASEMGLRSAMTPSSMMESVYLAFEPLRAHCLDALRADGAKSSVRVAGPSGDVRVDVDPQRDALLFGGLYEDLSLYRAQVAGKATSSELDARVLQGYLFPLAGRELFATPELRGVIVARLNAHHAQHGPSVAERNLRALKHTFRVADSVLSLLPMPEKEFST